MAEERVRWAVDVKYRSYTGGVRWAKVRLTSDDDESVAKLGAVAIFKDQYPELRVLAVRWAWKATAAFDLSPSVQLEERKVGLVWDKDRASHQTGWVTHKQREERQARRRRRKKASNSSSVSGDPDQTEALLPDGSRCEWDERLRTVGAHQVDKE